MRYPLFAVLIAISLAYTRPTTFNGSNAILDLQQGVEAFAQADIDRDGDIDWAAQARTDGMIALIFNERFGNYTSNLLNTSVRDIYSLDLGDVDGDSFDDVLVAGCEGTSANIEHPANLSVIHAGSDRMYDDSTDLGTTQEVRAARFMDINGDGRLDILAATGRDNSVICWFENNNSGWVKREIDSDIGDLMLNSWIEIADLDGDGKQDFLLGDYMDYAIWWYRGDGAGTFTKQVVARDIQLGRGVVTDIDLDGDLDIINGKFILYRDGGGFTKTTISDPPTNDAHAIAAGDVNRDGYPDIVAAVWEEGVYLWQSIPGKKFARTNLSGGSDVKKLAIGDADHDRFADVIYIEQTAGTLAYDRNTAVFAFEPKVLLAKRPYLSGLSVRDADNDGDADLIVTDRSSFVVYENRGDSLAATFGGNCESYSNVHVADVNDDGKIDFVVNESNSTVWHEQGIFPAYTRHYLPNYLDPLAVIDRNGDGSDEVAGKFVNTQKEPFLLANSYAGEGQFTVDTLYDQTFKSFYFQDLDNDGAFGYTFYDNPANRYVNYDLNRDGKVELLYYDAETSGFGVKSNFLDTSGDGESDRIERVLMKGSNLGGGIAAGDLDKDGRDDIVLGNGSSNNLFWCSQDTQFRFNAALTVGPGNFAYDVAVVDFDRDGWLDVISCDSHDIYLHRNLLGIPPAKAEIPVATLPRGITADRKAVAPRPFGAGCFAWELQPGIAASGLRFFRMNGALTKVPVYMHDNILIADFRRRSGGGHGIFTWALTDGTGRRIGNGLISAVR